MQVRINRTSALSNSKLGNLLPGENEKWKKIVSS